MGEFLLLFIISILFVAVSQGFFKRKMNVAIPGLSQAIALQMK
jgi:hypothetical protein